MELIPSLSPSDKYRFTGTHFGLVDEKARLSIPSTFKQYLDTKAILYLTPATSGRLNAYPAETFVELWKKVQSGEADLGGLSRTDAEMIVLGDSVEKTVDSQGRITVPQELLDRAKIGREIVFLGRWDFFNIWNRQVFEEHRNKLTKTLSDGQAWEVLNDMAKKGQGK